MKSILFFLAIALHTLLFAQKLIPVSTVNLDIDEPSGIAFNKELSTYYIISDNGYLFQTDLTGKTIHSSSFKGYDFEGITFAKNKIYVSDEMMRKVHVFDLNLKKTNTYQLNYQGGRNKGFESIAFIPEKNQFVLISEKEKIFIRKYDLNFRMIDEIIYDNLRDVSAVSYFDGFIYLLSDEDRTIVQMNLNFEEIKRFEIPIINPEGIAFNNKSQMLIVSDNREKLYTFNKDW
ncbi:MAG: SdiA-regulated domain-containing protein [Flavobacteriales bacterium]|nr:SdiA-regulated domain-containing protein [Flavobacteriales bacterium]